MSDDPRPETEQPTPPDTESRQTVLDPFDNPVPTPPHPDGESETEESEETDVAGEEGRDEDAQPNNEHGLPGKLRPGSVGNDVAIAERREKVLTYRKAGASMRAIGTKLGVSVTTVYRDLQHALDELQRTEIKEARSIRALEASRLDEMFQSVWPEARRGTPVAIDLALKLMERKAKLFGLDAAVKVDVLMQEERQALLEILQKNLPEDEFRKVLGVLAVTATADNKA